MSTPNDQLADATVPGGILAINPSGHLVRLRPGSVHLAADVERGVYLVGLKKGWRLATPEDKQKKIAAEKDNERRNKRGEPSPKTAGA